MNNMFKKQQKSGEFKQRLEIYNRIELNIGAEKYNI